MSPPPRSRPPHEHARKRCHKSDASKMPNNTPHTHTHTHNHRSQHATPSSTYKPLIMNLKLRIQCIPPLPSLQQNGMRQGNRRNIATCEEGGTSKATHTHTQSKPASIVTPPPPSLSSTVAIFLHSRCLCLAAGFTPRFPSVVGGGANHQTPGKRVKETTGAAN